ncbi:MAG: serine acetyltransferase [Paraprevotella sp.]|jgi:serine O-acetyltransferase|nr:serine acetyltransferase [Paraprevotella sp.]
MNKDFKRRMQEELCCYDTSFRAFLLGYDSWYIGTYIRCKRITSYYCGKSLIYKMIMGWLIRSLGRKLVFQFGMASIGFGIKIFHWGSIVINDKAIIGDNFCVYPGVCIGRTVDGGVPKIGNNVTFFTNSGAYGGITIGNNVTVAPNAVVTHDIPDNCIVAGIPAKIIKYKSINNEN